MNSRRFLIFISCILLRILKLNGQQPVEECPDFQVEDGEVDMINDKVNFIETLKNILFENIFKMLNIKGLFVSYVTF